MLYIRVPPLFFATPLPHFEISRRPRYLTIPRLYQTLPPLLGQDNAIELSQIELMGINIFYVKQRTLEFEHYTD